MNDSILLLRLLGETFPGLTRDLRGRDHAPQQFWFKDDPWGSITFHEVFVQVMVSLYRSFSGVVGQPQKEKT